ncbi:hypothetical protein A3I40_02225 [Candidatus Uhrbacteria bacterium RIFCSPLOWO2_02_FULL_48_12]|uniref:Uncharacterized protein n=1 Tax=Candidatus Uhrbacteria bacterium RIFCSPLOWO2_02_FULL_48_12 TaxID=1802407 RepID=A0A1F7V9S8_9BACT|nr:MAG: hypothetical protein A3I40_02225 [Candidatus Uhrbacteria bacterium RIFCSPLOWO2_02_FULL_48_12]
MNVNVRVCIQEIFCEKVSSGGTRFSSQKIPCLSWMQALTFTQLLQKNEDVIFWLGERQLLESTFWIVPLL